MAQQIIDIGTVADDGTGDTFRDAFDKVNDNDTEIYSKAVMDNTIVINTASDFPTAVAGVITLVDLTTYKIGNADVNISPNRLVIDAGDTVIIKAENGFNSKISSDTTAALITSTDGLLVIDRIALQASNGRILDLTQSAGVCAVVAESARFIGSAFPSELDNLTIAAFFTCQFTNCVGGVFKFIGATFGEFLSLSSNYDAGNTGDVIDLASAVLTAFDLLESRFVSSASNVYINSDVGSSGNIASGSIGKVLGTRITGTAPTLTSVSPSDLRFEFQGNNGINNSIKSADAFLTATETVTIGVAGTFVAINGVNWSSDIAERFTISTAGLATYTSEVPTVCLVTTTATVEKVGGGADEIEMKIAINGTVVDKTVSATENATPTTIPSQGSFNLVENDTIQTFVANIDSTANITVSSADMIIINGF